MMKLVSDLPVIHVPIGKLASERHRDDERKRRARVTLVLVVGVAASVAGWVASAGAR